MKRITRNVGLSVVLIVSFLAFAVAPVAAADTIAGSRIISDTTVAPGDTFTVTVTVDITGAVYGPLLNEDVPAGWAVTEVDNAGGTYNPTDIKWLWGGSQTTDKTVIYNVTVPAGATDGSYDLTGTVLATVGGSTIGPFTVTGANSVTVTGGAADTIAGSRIISDTTVAPGDTFTVTVTVDITGAVYGPLLNEDVPAGWAVTEVDNAGGTYNPTDIKWLWGGSQTTDKTVIYNVTVPAGATDGSYDLTGTVLATVGGSTIGPFTVTGANSVTVTGGAADTIAGSRIISDTTVAPGDTFTVTVTVDITGAVYGPLLNEDVPAGWAVTEVDNAGGTYNPTDIKWLWGGSQTTDKTVIYNVTVPAGATDGSYDLTGTVLATVGGSTIGPFTVTGVNSVTVTDASVPDTTDPTIQSVTLSPTSTVPGGSVTVTVVATDASGIASVTANGTTGTISLTNTGGDTWAGTITAPSTDGTYTVTVIATDASANANEATDTSKSFTVAADVTAPTISSVTLSPTSTVPGGSVTVTVVATDASGIASVTANGTTGTISLTNTGGDTWAGTITAPSTDGAYEVTVIATDASANANEATDTSPFTVAADITAPTISSVTLSPTSVGQGGLVTVTVVATDISGIDSMTANGTTGTVTLTAQGNNEWRGTITAPSTAGTYTVTVVATDASPNANTATDPSKSFTVCENSCTITLSTTGYTLIAMPLNDPGISTASDLANRIAGCAEVVKYDETTGAFVSYVPGNPLNDFAIVKGRGYFVNGATVSSVTFHGSIWT